MLEVSMALIIVSRLVGPEMIPAVLPLVREKLHHPKYVKKSLILCIYIVVLLLIDAFLCFEGNLFVRKHY